MAQTAPTLRGDFVRQGTLPHGSYWAESRRFYDRIYTGVARADKRARALFGAYNVNVPEYRLFLVTRESQLRMFVGAGFPDWGAAAAIPTQNMIVIKAPSLTTADKPLPLLAAHEYAHLLAAELSGGRTPRWLDEGFAMYLSSEWSFDDFTAISLASVRGEFIPLSEIADLNSFSEAQAHVAYAQCYLAVKYLAEYYDPATLRALFSALKRGKGIDAALRELYGIDQAGFEEELFAHIRANYTLTGILMNSSLFWIALAGLVVLGAYLARRRKADRYKQWDEEERLQSTDFDYGDPDNPEKIDDEDRPWE